MAGQHLPAYSRGFTRISADGRRERIERSIATEMPIGIEVNGIGYAVLFATPSHLGDLALGFALSERLADDAADMVDLDIFERDADILIRIMLSPDKADRIAGRVRHRATDSSCGLCGIESLEQAVRPLPPVRDSSEADDRAVFRALREIEQAQLLNRETRAVHAAALCDATGSVLMVREDVGRHNAFDKLIGAMAADSVEWNGGFALLTSRCSNELVEKAVLAQCPMLVTVSAPTDLALSRARAAGLKLKTLARTDALLDSDLS